jgi:(1->4)-alpha-D-glucan 1-alpha-D-glucosylmutase
VVPRLTLVLGGDWADTTCEVPPGPWVDRFTGARFGGGAVPVAELLAGFPVALLARDAGEGPW